MKRFRRWLFNGLAALSLLLCVVTLALLVLSFVHSYALSQCVYLPVAPGAVPANFHPLATQRYTVLGVNHGRIMVAQSLRAIDLVLPAWGWTLNMGAPNGINVSQHIGFDYTKERQPGWAYIRLVVPLWELTAILAVLPIAWKRMRPGYMLGLCPSCGYDLRATPDRCPECGTVPSKKEIISTGSSN